MVTEQCQTVIVREEVGAEKIGSTGPDALQFSLSTLFGLTAAVAITCSLFFSMPAVAAMPLMVLISVGLPAALTMVLIYRRGYQRAFCIGALFPAATMMLCTCLMLFVHSISAYQNEINEWTQFANKVGPYYRVFIGGTWVLCLLVGLMTSIMHWLMLRDSRVA